LRLQEAGMHKEAIKHFLIAVRHFPDNRDLFYYLATSYSKTENPMLAHDFYRRCTASRTYSAVCRSGMAKTEKAALEQAKQQKETPEVLLPDRTTYNK
jgi:hypothetical protein